MRALLGSSMAGAILLGGCSSWVSVHPMPHGEKAAQVDGIPFRSMAHYELTLYERQADGTWKKIETGDNAPIRQVLPDQSPDGLHVLKYYGMLLSNTTAKVTLGPGNTLKSINLGDVGQADEALTAAGTQLKALETARTEAEASEETETTSERDVNLALEEALAEVQRARLARDVFKQGTSDWKLADVEYRLAQIRANDKAVRAGVSPPYPDVTLAEG